jgi:hypothetical protein
MAWPFSSLWIDFLTCGIHSFKNMRKWKVLELEVSRSPLKFTRTGLHYVLLFCSDIMFSGFLFQD